MKLLLHTVAENPKRDISLLKDINGYAATRYINIIRFNIGLTVVDIFVYNYCFCIHFYVLYTNLEIVYNSKHIHRTKVACLTLAFFIILGIPFYKN